MRTLHCLTVVFSIRYYKEYSFFFLLHDLIQYESVSSNCSNVRGSKKENLYIIQIYIDLVYCNSLFIINFIADADQDSHRLDKRRSSRSRPSRGKGHYRDVWNRSRIIYSNKSIAVERKNTEDDRGSDSTKNFFSQLHNSFSLSKVRFQTRYHLSPLYCIMQALSQSVMMSPSHRQTVLSSVIPSP